MTIKKKLRDLTEEEWDKWLEKGCFNNCFTCKKCPLKRAYCYRSTNESSWINNKDVYSDKFLNQEIEIEEDYE